MTGGNCVWPCTASPAASGDLGFLTSCCAWACATPTAGRPPRWTVTDGTAVTTRRTGRCCRGGRAAAESGGTGNSDSAFRLVAVAPPAARDLRIRGGMAVRRDRPEHLRTRRHRRHRGSAAAGLLLARVTAAEPA